MTQSNMKRSRIITPRYDPQVALLKEQKILDDAGQLLVKYLNGLEFSSDQLKRINGLGGICARLIENIIAQEKRREAPQDQRQEIAPQPSAEPQPDSSNQKETADG